MTTGVSAGAGAGAGAAAAAIANAIKASGAIVRVEPDDFQKIMAKSDAPLVVQVAGGEKEGFLSKKRKGKCEYLTAYKGLIFYTKSDSELRFEADTEVVLAKKIWVPG